MQPTNVRTRLFGANSFACTILWRTRDVPSGMHRILAYTAFRRTHLSGVHNLLAYTALWRTLSFLAYSVFVRINNLPAYTVLHVHNLFIYSAFSSTRPSGNVLTCTRSSGVNGLLADTTFLHVRPSCVHDFLLSTRPSSILTRPNVYVATFCVRARQSLAILFAYARNKRTYNSCPAYESRSCPGDHLSTSH